jgi:hypothetical protein
MFAAAAVLMLASLVPASTVHAKACPALCKIQIKACKSGCSKPKAKCKRDCKKHFVGECKLTAPKAKDRTCPMSPSGAFID